MAGVAWGSRSDNPRGGTGRYLHLSPLLPVCPGLSHPQARKHLYAPSRCVRSNSALARRCTDSSAQCTDSCSERAEPRPGWLLAGSRISTLAGSIEPEAGSMDLKIEPAPEPFGNLTIPSESVQCAPVGAAGVGDRVGTFGSFGVAQACSGFSTKAVSSWVTCGSRGHSVRPAAGSGVARAGGRRGGPRNPTSGGGDGRPC